MVCTVTTVLYPGDHLFLIPLAKFKLELELGNTQTIAVNQVPPANLDKFCLFGCCAGEQQMQATF